MLASRPTGKRECAGYKCALQTGRGYAGDAIDRPPLTDNGLARQETHGRETTVEGRTKDRSIPHGDGDQQLRLTRFLNGDIGQGRDRLRQVKIPEASDG